VGGGRPRILGKKTAGLPREGRESTAEMKIAIIGKGNVGSALAEGLRRSAQKHEIRFASRDVREPIRGAVEWSDVVILAVPWSAHQSVVNEGGESFDGKTVVDVSNVLGPSFELAVGFTTSGAEELQKMMPKAKIVKAFNTVFAQNMSSGRLNGEPLSAFLAGDDPAAKDRVREIGEDIGFDIIDAGPLRSARLLEPVGMLNITLGYGLKMGTNIGFVLKRPKTAEKKKAA
jgi:predicted dinucleotide-binding enzyme